MKKLTKYVLVGVAISGTVLILLIGMLLLFIRPIDGMITEDRPVLSFLCNLQVDCGDNPHPHFCSKEFDDSNFDVDLAYEDRKISISTLRLLNWKGYNGCNESTNGFGGEYIKINSCSCGYPV